MYHIQGTPKQHCSLLAVLCGNCHERQRGEEKLRPSPSSYPIPELVSSGRLEVSVLLWCKDWIFVVVHLLYWVFCLWTQIQTLINPTFDKFREAFKLAEPNILYFQGERLENEEIGSLVWGSVDMSDPQMLRSLIGPALPTIVSIYVWLAFCAMSVGISHWIDA